MATSMKKKATTEKAAKKSNLDFTKFIMPSQQLSLRHPKKSL